MCGGSTHDHVEYTYCSCQILNWCQQRTFLLVLARLSSHRFPNRQEEKAALIYNYHPVYTGDIITMLQCYFWQWSALAKLLYTKTGEWSKQHFLWRQRLRRSNAPGIFSAVFPSTAWQLFWWLALTGLVVKRNVSYQGPKKQTKQQKKAEPL